jgi:hypothetical protein
MPEALGGLSADGSRHGPPDACRLVLNSNKFMSVD